MLGVADSILSILSSAMEISQNLMERARKKADLELHSLIFDLQGKIAAGLSQIVELKCENEKLKIKILHLKEELAKLKKWEADTKNCRLTELAPGVYVVAEELEVDGEKKTFYYCPNCIHSRRKMFLNFYKKGDTIAVGCPHCSYKAGVNADFQLLRDLSL